MRTTLTLDDDVAARLNAAVRKQRRPFKALVNEALRSGLDTVDRPGPARRPFRTRGFNLGPSLVGSLDNIEEVLSRVDGEAHRVILVDANILLYAANHAAPEHAGARSWLDEQLNGTSRVGLPWPSLLAFVRLASNPVVVRHAVTPGGAWRQVEEWLACESAWIPAPGPRHGEVLGALIARPWMSSRLVPDAHLAALAVEHGLTLCSTDGDFAKCPGLAWKNPLAADNPSR